MAFPVARLPELMRAADAAYRAGLTVDARLTEAAEGRVLAIRTRPALTAAEKRARRRMYRDDPTLAARYWRAHHIREGFVFLDNAARYRRLAKVRMSPVSRESAIQCARTYLASSRTLRLTRAACGSRLPEAA